MWLGGRDRPRTFSSIGHSHGGNVILRAIRKLNLRDFVPDVITMATPFVEVETQVGHIE